MAPDIIERWKALVVSIALALLYVYRSNHLPMLDPSPSTLTVLNSNFLQLGRSGGQPQRIVHPRRLPVNTVIHTTLVGLELTTFRLLVPMVRRATSSATDTLN